ncbi:MAG: helix-turn-helix transcriptional regulator [Deltaproteobacteria bacterium]|nr:helix-turn-helix transcriptional regulator [Deltaproteobacteria bacterium]
MRRLGHRLAMLQQHQGLSQVQLAKWARVTQGYIAQLEAGDKTPSLPALRRLAMALDVKVAELVE